MAGPTAEVLNDDLKDLRDDFHKAQLELKDDFKRVEVSQAELKTQLRLLINIATLGITIVTGLLITGAASGIWWASKIDYKVDQLETRFDKLESKSERVESRLEKLESKLDRLLDQTKPK